MPCCTETTMEFLTLHFPSEDWGEAIREATAVMASWQTLRTSPPADYSDKNAEGLKHTDTYNAEEFKHTDTHNAS